MINKVALILIFIAGAVILLAALLNWKIFLSNAKADFFTEKWGPAGARVAYAIIGLAIIGMGIYALYNGFLEDVYE